MTSKERTRVPHGLAARIRGHEIYCGNQVRRGALPAFAKDNGSLSIRPQERRDIELYDITSDPGETNNIASKEPEIIKRLSTKAQAWIATLPKNTSRQKMPKSDVPDAGCYAECHWLCQC